MNVRRLHLPLDRTAMSRLDLRIGFSLPGPLRRTGPKARARRERNRARRP